MPYFQKFLELTPKQVNRLKGSLQFVEWEGLENKKYRFTDCARLGIFETVEVWKYPDESIWYHLNVKVNRVDNWEMIWRSIYIKEEDFELFMNSNVKFYIDTESNIVLESIGQAVLESI